MILAFSLSMLFLFDLDLKSSTWLLEGAAPGGPVHRPARRSVARRRDEKLFSWWWAISSDSLQHPGWFCDILHRNLKEYHRTTLERNLSTSPPPPAAGFPGGGSTGGGVLRRYILLSIMGIGDELSIFP